MRSTYNMSETEQEVMEKLWDQGEGVRQAQLLALFEEEGKEWKRQTLNTFLSRLEEKGMVRKENRIVTPVYSREEYYLKQMKSAIDHMYGGKLSNLVSAFTQENSISRQEAEELVRILEKY